VQEKEKLFFLFVYVRRTTESCFFRIFARVSGRVSTKTRKKEQVSKEARREKIGGVRSLTRASRDF